MTDQVAGVTKERAKESNAQVPQRSRKRHAQPPAPVPDETERRAELSKAQPDVGGNLHATI